MSSFLPFRGQVQNLFVFLIMTGKSSYGIILMIQGHVQGQFQVRFLNIVFLPSRVT